MVRCWAVGAAACLGVRPLAGARCRQVEFKLPQDTRRVSSTVCDAGCQSLCLNRRHGRMRLLHRLCHGEGGANFQQS